MLKGWVSIVTGVMGISFNCREVYCPTRVHENPNIALDITRTSECCLHLYGSYHSNATLLCTSTSD